MTDAQHDDDNRGDDMTLETERDRRRMMLQHRCLAAKRPIQMRYGRDEFYRLLRREYGDSVIRDSTPALGRRLGLTHSAVVRMWHVLERSGKAERVGVIDKSGQIGWRLL